MTHETFTTKLTYVMSFIIGCALGWLLAGL